MKEELGGKIMRKFAACLLHLEQKHIQATTAKIKKAKGTKKWIIKRKLKFEDYKHSFDKTQLENKINQLEKNKGNIDSPRENRKEFIKNNKLLPKSQQRFSSEKLNVFTEEANKIAMSANDNKTIQSIDSIETYAHGTSKNQKRKKEIIN